MTDEARRKAWDKWTATHNRENYGRCDAFRAGYAAAQEEAQKERDKVVWILESDIGGTPIYWRKLHRPVGGSSWTSEATEAVHFADERSANIVAHVCGLKDRWKVVEHMFCAALKSAGEAK